MEKRLLCGCLVSQYNMSVVMEPVVCLVKTNVPRRITKMAYSTYSLVSCESYKHSTHDENEEASSDNDDNDDCLDTMT